MTALAVSVKATKSLLVELQNANTEELKKSEMVIIKAQAEALMAILVEQQAEVKLMKSQKSSKPENDEGDTAEEQEQPAPAPKNLLAALLACTPMQK